MIWNSFSFHLFKLNNVPTFPEFGLYTFEKYENHFDLYKKMNSNVFNIINVYEYWCVTASYIHAFPNVFVDHRGIWFGGDPRGPSPAEARGLLGVWVRWAAEKNMDVMKFILFCAVLQKKPFPAKIPWERGRNHMLQLQLWTQYQMGYSIRQDNLMKSSLKWPKHGLG